ncbi:hypothetical protein V6N13_035716 [Hibiscus sabdariffa]
MAPLSAAMGPNCLLIDPPALKSAMSTSSKLSAVSSWTVKVRSWKEMDFPAERLEARSLRNGKGNHGRRGRRGILGRRRRLDFGVERKWALREWLREAIVKLKEEERRRGGVVGNAEKGMAAAAGVVIVSTVTTGSCSDSMSC